MFSQKQHQEIIENKNELLNLKWFAFLKYNYSADQALLYLLFVFK